MIVSYNGIDMELCEIVKFTREGVYTPDGAELLFVNCHISVVCNLAPGGYPRGVSLRSYPGATTIRDTGPTPARAHHRNSGVTIPEPASAMFVPPSTPPDRVVRPHAFLTDHEVRARLMQPRRAFSIKATDQTMGDLYWIRLPRYAGSEAVSNSKGAVDIARTLGQVSGVISASANSESLGYCDPNNGPRPLQVDVVKSIGEGVFQSILFTLEFAYIPVDLDQERLILSHRWETQYASDESQQMTRVTHGSVVFNGSMLAKYVDGISGFARESPDLYRNQFCHPIPLGFVRSLPEFSISSDGLNIKYTIHDVQPTMIFDPGDSGAVKLDIQETMNFLSPDYLGAFWKAGGKDLSGYAAKGSSGAAKWLGRNTGIKF